MTSTYNKSTHSFQEQPEIEKPIRQSYQKCVAMPFYEVDCFTDDKYYSDIKLYEQYIASLRTLPCRPGDVWEEGKMYEQGKDYFVHDGNKWCYIKCKCGWEGSSENLLGGTALADTGDYSDVYCPKCKEVEPDEDERVSAYAVMAIAIPKTPPPPAQEAELWKDVIAEAVSCTEYGLGIDVALIEKLQQKYAISLKGGQP